MRKRRKLFTGDGPVPEWPLPDTHVMRTGDTAAAKPREPPVAFRAISDGTCASRGLGLLKSDECESLALQQPKHTFIGRTRERQEYPGCIRWGGGFVEYNAHSEETGGCHATGDEANGIAPACLCAAAAKG